jgi:hypothetical protein
MLKPLLVALDVLLVAGAGALGLQLHRIWTEPPPAAAAPAAASAPAAEPAAATQARPPAPSAAAYTVIAERNLFSPTRTEAGPEPPPRTTVASVATNPAATRPAEKPRLYGVVIGTDGGSRAYLWDPQTKRVFGYKIGDSLAENRVEQITADRVTLRRGTDVYDVLLRDPSKPKPPPVAATIPTAPGQIPGMPPVQPGIPGGEGAPPFVPPAIPVIPGQPPVPGQTVVPGQIPGGMPQRPFPVVPGRALRPGMPGAMPVPTQPPQSGDPDS